MCQGKAGERKTKPALHFAPSLQELFRMPKLNGRGSWLDFFVHQKRRWSVIMKFCTWSLVYGFIYRALMHLICMTLSLTALGTNAAEPSSWREFIYSSGEDKQTEQSVEVCEREWMRDRRTLKRDSCGDRNERVQLCNIKCIKWKSQFSVSDWEGWGKKWGKGRLKMIEGDVCENPSSVLCNWSSFLPACCSVSKGCKPILSHACVVQ